MLRQLCFTNDVTALAVCHATIMFMVLLQNDCTTLGQVFDTACTVQGFDTATRADVEGSIEANWKKSDLKKEVLACFCFQLLLSTGANWRFYALVSAIVRIYLQGPVDKGNVSLRPPPLVTVFCRPDFKYYIFCLRGSDADYLYGVIVSLKKAIHVIFWQHLTVFINIVFVSLRRWVDKGSKIPIQGRIRSEKFKKKSHQIWYIFLKLSKTMYI